MTKPIAASADGEHERHDQQPLEDPDRRPDLGRRGSRRVDRWLDRDRRGWRFLLLDGRGERPDPEVPAPP